MIKRLLVTGSRTWTNRRVIYDALLDARDYLGWPDVAVTLMHGGASGADRIASVIGKSWGMPVMTMRADWLAPCRAECAPDHRRTNPEGESICPMAGLYRNAAMVEAGADLVLAFILNGSRGATHCASLAERAGIPVRRFEVRS